MVIFFNISPTSNHLHPPQVENCDSNSRLVVDEDDNGKLRLERVKIVLFWGQINRLKTPMGVIRTQRVNHLSPEGADQILSKTQLLKKVNMRRAYFYIGHIRKKQHPCHVLIMYLSTLRAIRLITSCLTSDVGMYFYVKLKLTLIMSAVTTHSEWQVACDNAVNYPNDPFFISAPAILTSIGEIIKSQI